MKNITFTAEDHLIAQARGLAQLRGTTLNEEFRAWIASYITGQSDAVKEMQTRNLIDQLTAPSEGASALQREQLYASLQEPVAARNAFNERELRMLDRLDGKTSSGAI